MVRGFFHDRLRPFVEITNKYRTPRIKMTRQVKIALLILRIYLLAMVVLLIYTLLTTV